MRDRNVMEEQISVIHPRVKAWGQQVGGQEACAAGTPASSRAAAAAPAHLTSAFVLKDRDDNEAGLRS